MNHTNIFYFHGVERSSFPIGGFATLFELRDVLKELKQFFELIPLSTVLSGRSEDPHYPFGALTIDDGLDVIRSGIFELICELRIPCTCFLVTSCMGNRLIMWQHRLKLISTSRGARSTLHAVNTEVQIPNGYSKVDKIDQLMHVAQQWPIDRRHEFVDSVWNACAMPPTEHYLEQRPYMEWEDLGPWLAEGHEVGLHTDTHPFCSQLDERACEAELMGPARDLLRRCGGGQVPVSYPFGDRAMPHIEQALANCGLFSCLLGIRGPSSRDCSPFSLERMSLDQGINDGVFGRGLMRVARESFFGLRRVSRR